MRSFFNEVPVELGEVALVDGYSRWEVFWRIDLPLVKLGLIACAIYTFVMCLNEFFLAFILTGTRVKPATVAVINFLPTDVRGTIYGQAAVAGLLMMSPAMIFFLFLQKHFVLGLIRGAFR
jgi:multiple sugar transport system permease protein